MVIGRDDLPSVEFVGRLLGDGPAPDDTKDIDVDYYVTGFEFMSYGGLRSLL